MASEEQNERTRAVLRAKDTEKENELIEEIIRATNDERLSWLPTARPYEYTGALNGRWSILVGKEAHDIDDYYVRIANIRGQTVLRRSARGIEVSSGPDQHWNPDTAPDLIRDLFNAASRNASHSDKRIDELLEDLKSSHLF